MCSLCDGFHDDAPVDQLEPLWDEMVLAQIEFKYRHDDATREKFHFIMAYLYDRGDLKLKGEYWRSIPCLYSWNQSEIN